MKNLLPVLAGCLVACAAPATPPPTRPEPAAETPSPVTVAQIRVERRTDPIGIDTPSPHLSWQLVSSENDQAQSAYQVQVATSPNVLAAGRGDLWDAGRVSSNASIEVPYGGKSLASRQTAYWRVRVWDRQARPSAWSATGSWEMGLLSPGDWHARFIGRPANPALPPPLDAAAVRWIWFPLAPGVKPKDQPWAFLRTTITTPDPATLARASAYVGAAGLFHLYVNGDLVHSGHEGKHVRFVDAKPFLVKGKNVIAIAARSEFDDAGGIAFALRLEPVRSGRVQVFTSDGKWRASQSEPDGWQSPAFDDRGWKPAREVAKFGQAGAAPFDKVAASALLVADGESPAYLYRRACVDTPATPNGRPVRARLYASALGLYEISLNGKRVGDQVLAPGWTDYRKRLEYQTYDVTELFDGPCYTLAATLADGWYAGSVGFEKQRNIYGGYPLRLLAQLEVTWPDGRVDRVVTDGDWRAGSGPIRRTDLLDGERYDARRELPGWPVPSAPPADFEPVDVLAQAPPARLVAQAGPPIRVVSDHAPRSVTEPRPGRFVFDLGQNLVGWVKLKVQGPTGARVTLRFAEMLNPDGTIYTRNLRTADASDTYILRGEPGGETWEPRFTTHGFRYVEVTGFPGTPAANALLAKVVQSDTRPTGRFETSNPLVNQLQSNIVWGQRGNFVGLPTDCPQRDERLGWMGDAQIFARTACFNADVGNFFAKWLRDVYDDQDAEGGLADTVPYVDGLGRRPGAPAWADAGVIVPWTLYQCTGDRRFLAEHFDGMKRHIALVLRENPDLIWKNAVGGNYGDWLSVNAKTSKPLLATAYFAYSAGLVAQIADRLGRADDARSMRDLKKKIAARFNEVFVKDDGHIEGDTQTAYLLALQFDLLSPERRKQAEAHLVAAIERADFHLTTGFLGVRELLPALTTLGRLDLAYRLLENDTFPSWGYSIKQGATTIWERWDGWTTDKGFQSEGMNSFNHYSLGSVGQWMYATIAGLDINPDFPDAPAYAHAIIRPRPGGGITSARASLETPYGKLESRWTLANGRFKLAIDVPVNTRATVILPDGKSIEVGSGRRELESAFTVAR